jgi:hypothetical protein
MTFTARTENKVPSTLSVSYRQYLSFVGNDRHIVVDAKLYSVYVINQIIALSSKCVGEFDSR